MTMNVNSLLRRAEIYNCIMVYSLAMTVYLAINLLDDRKPEIVVFAAIALIEGVSYFSRRVIDRMILYLVAHFAVLVVLIFLPFGPVGIMAAMIAWVAFLILDLYIWGKAGVYGFSYIPLALDIVPAILYFLAWLARNTFNMYCIFGFGVLYYVLYYLRQTNINIYYLSQEGNGSENMPLSVIRKNTFIMILPPLILSAVVMVLTRADYLNEQIWTFFKKLAAIVLFIGYIIIYFFDMIISFIAGDYEEDAMQYITQAAAAVEEKDSVAINIFEDVIVVAILGVVVFIIFRIVKSIIDGIEKKSEPIVETVNRTGMIEIREKIKKPVVVDNRNLHKVRREYKNKIEKAVAKGYILKPGQTPEERMGDLREATGEDIAELTGRYENVRYGKEE